VSVLKEMKEYDSEKVHKYTLSKDEIIGNLDKFLELSLEERKGLKGLHPKRAEVIVSGTLLLLWIMEILGKDEVTVSESDILEGMMKKSKK
jgi:exopolyphosphatase/guanosine-5'-triphosphate,3'-diphosphate pyrophosphatase